MSIATLILGLVGLSVALALWFLVWFCVRGPSLTKTVVKTASVAGLAAAAWLALAPLWLVAALGLAALGDFFLSREGDGAFLAGLSAFALAHLAYVALILVIDVPLSMNALSLGVMVFSAVMAFVIVPRAGSLRWPVLTYIVVIGAMGTLTLSLPASFATAMVAAVLFMLSDMILGLERFVWGPVNSLSRAAPYAIWSTYWVAQLLFLVAFAFERSL